MAGRISTKSVEWHRSVEPVAHSLESEGSLNLDIVNAHYHYFFPPEVRQVRHLFCILPVWLREGHSLYFQPTDHKSSNTTPATSPSTPTLHHPLSRHAPARDPRHLAACDASAKVRATHYEPLTSSSPSPSEIHTCPFGRERESPLSPDMHACCSCCRAVVSLSAIRISHLLLMGLRRWVSTRSVVAVQRSAPCNRRPLALLVRPQARFSVSPAAYRCCGARARVPRSGVK